MITKKRILGIVDEIGKELIEENGAGNNVPVSFVIDTVIRELNKRLD